MKHLQNALAVIALCAISAISLAANAPKKQEVTFQVDGVCGMCEERIEGALDVKGVVMADWDQETKALTVVFKPNQITEAQLHELINAAGHDTEKSAASDEEYEGLHGCCKYREGGGAKCSGGGR